jgi:hypothetical protein
MTATLPVFVIKAGRLVCRGLVISLLGSCSAPDAGRTPADAAPPAVPPALVRRSGVDGGTPVAPPAPVAAQLTPEEEIVFTDPDNPDATLPELSTLLSAAPKRREAWEQSESVAKRRAAREGKPLLIWFTDSARSPMCKALNEELFSNPEFEKWAGEKLVRLRIDANVRLDETDLSLGEKESRLVDLGAYVTRMKKQYKVLGQPVLVLLNPAGEVIGRYRGYKRGEADFKWGLIKQGEAAATHGHRIWRESLEQKGYREWRDRQGRRVFARLVAYADGHLTLVEPDGTRSRTHEDKLSEEDREWIDGQKRNRGL